MTRPFLSCDWGTSSFRLRLVEAEPFSILAEVRSGEGVAAVRRQMELEGLAAAAAFQRVLTGRIVELLGLASPEARPPGDLSCLPLVISGMASSSIGWRELPYGSLPFPLDGKGVERSSFDLDGRPAILLSGLTSGADVLRGEETEVLGLLDEPELRPLRAGCLILLPGTHSKHVHIEREAIVAFTTYMTGELYSVLATRSILQHSVDIRPEGAASVSQESREEAFSRGAARAREQPLSAALFSVRTNQLLGRLHPALNAAFLSGLLVGAEVLGAAAACPPGLPLLLAAGPGLAREYVLAFEALLLRAGLEVVAPAAAAAASARGHAVVLRRLHGVSSAP